MILNEHYNTTHLCDQKCDQHFIFHCLRLTWCTFNDIILLQPHPPLWFNGRGWELVSLVLICLKDHPRPSSDSLPIERIDFWGGFLGHKQPVSTLIVESLNARPHLEAFWNGTRIRFPCLKANAMMLSVFRVTHNAKGSPTNKRLRAEQL